MSKNLTKKLSAKYDGSMGIPVNRHQSFSNTMSIGLLILLIYLLPNQAAAELGPSSPTRSPAIVSATFSEATSVSQMSAGERNSSLLARADDPIGNLIGKLNRDPSTYFPAVPPEDFKPDESVKLKENRVGQTARKGITQNQEKKGVEKRDLLTTLVNRRYGIPVALFPRVRAFLNYFLGRGKWTIRNWLRRGSRYLVLLRKILRKYGMPTELTWLAMIESGFNSTARSHAGAGGMWQFMIRTGSKYGLRHNRWIDERNNISKATDAAARHLRDLYVYYRDWHLALAAYNTGQGKVDRGLRRFGVKTYWELSEHRWLAEETKAYVPKFLAAMIMAENKALFPYLRRIKNRSMPACDQVKLKYPIDLRVAAVAARTTYKKLRKLNTELRNWCTPPFKGGYVLRIPRGKSGQFKRYLRRHGLNRRVVYHRHRVRFGESLSHIARTYQVSEQRITRINRLRRRYVRTGKWLIIPLPRGFSARMLASQGKYRRGKYAAAFPGRYRRLRGRKRVLYLTRKGHTLLSIARHFQVKLRSIRKWNGLKSYSLRPGRVLQLFVKRAFKTKGVLLVNPKKVRIAYFAKPKSRSRYASPRKWRRSKRSRYASPRKWRRFHRRSIRRATYRVRRGDTLWSISRRYKISVREIRRANDLKRGRPLRVGDKLTI